MSTLVYIMITIHSVAADTNKDDLERPIHLKVGLADVHRPMLSLSDHNEGSNGAISSTINSKMAAGGHFENFKWPHFCNALSASLYVCTQIIYFALGRCKLSLLTHVRLDTYLAREGNESICAIEKE